MVRWLDLGEIPKCSQVDYAMDWTWDLKAERVDIDSWVWGLSTWVNVEDGERWKCKVSFVVCHLCNDWPCFPWRILHFIVELPFPLLCGETFSLGIHSWGHQWCHREVSPGDVNLTFCLHLAPSSLWLLTPLVGMTGLDLIGPKRQASPSFRVGKLSCALHPPQVWTLYFILEFWLPFGFQFTKNTTNNVLSQIFEIFLRQFLLLLALEI